MPKKELPPVAPRRIRIAKERGLQNVDIIAITCREAGVPFPVACALFQKESGGRNVYGNDAGGMLSGYKVPVNRENYLAFRYMVVEKGHTSNGVGPSQITYAGSLVAGKRNGGFFREMELQGLKPWDVHDNMLFGLRLLKKYRQETGNWVRAGTKYNGATSYGLDLQKKIKEWRAAFKPA